MSVDQCIEIFRLLLAMYFFSFKISINLSIEFRHLENYECQFNCVLHLEAVRSYIEKGDLSGTYK